MAENRTMKEKPALCIQGMARKFVRESIIEDAATRLITQIMTEVADAHIAPRDAEITSLRAQLDEARARVAKLEKELEVEDHSHEQTVEDRDVAEDWADKLVERVEQLLDVDCGEHSNLNSPWKEACDYLDGAIANLAKPSSADEARRKAIEDAVNTAEQHSRLDVRCKCGFEIAEDIRALLSESKT